VIAKKFRGDFPGPMQSRVIVLQSVADLAGVERAELIAFYRGQRLENGITIDGDFDLTFRLCAMQRLMQALGAYAFLELVKGAQTFPAIHSECAAIVAFQSR
jgi:hypothetical protein